MENCVSLRRDFVLKDPSKSEKYGLISSLLSRFLDRHVIAGAVAGVSLHFLLPYVYLIMAQS